MCPIERQRGLSLIELILFIVIVGAALAGILAVFDLVTRGSADPLIRKQAIAIAESLMEEVGTAHYACPSGATCNPVTTANRAATHALADYNGFAMNGISAIDGTAIAHLAAYDADVRVRAETLGGQAGMNVAITVSRGGSEIVKLDGWRGQY